MAHFAKLDENNLVIDVVVVNNNDLLDASNNESEAIGIDFLTSWSDGYTNWRQTSYNGNFRKNYAGIGYTYDPQRDVFIPPKPFPSWILDETTCLWIPPIPMPEDDKLYRWDENTLTWVEIIYNLE